MPGGCAGSLRPRRSTCAAMRRSPRLTHCGRRDGSTRRPLPASPRAAARSARGGRGVDRDGLPLAARGARRPAAAGRQRAAGGCRRQPPHPGRAPAQLPRGAGVRGGRACLRPRPGRVAAVPPGIIVTARAEGDAHDFVSRYFAGHYGVDEDPVTGSAHCSLMPFWAERLGRTTLVGYQASRRGGVVRCTLRGDRVGLGGQAVTVVSGRLAGSTS